MKIAITNTVLSNTGDAAICLSIIDQLVAEHPTRDLEFTVFDSDAAATRKLYPNLRIVQQVTATRPFRPGKLSRLVSRLRIGIVSKLESDSLAARISAVSARVMFGRGFHDSLNAFREADLVISSGGTYLVDHYDFTVRTVELELAARLGLPIVLWTQSLGPFKTRRARDNAERIAAIADAVYFRDEKSARAWDSLSISHPNQQRAVAADSVFGLATPPRQPQAEPDRETMFLSVRRWAKTILGEPSDLQNYEAAMQMLVSRIPRTQRTVALSTCQGVPSYGYDDSLVARAFFAETDVEVDQDFHTPNALRARLAEARVVVATRMHFAILSMLAGAPVIAIAYEFKTIELFESLGLGRYCIAIDEVTGEWLEARVQEVLDDPARATVRPDRLALLRVSASLPAKAEVIARALSTAA